MKDFWNERYKEEPYIYGSEPNDFLFAHANFIKHGGKVLCLSEGEGRNAIYLAQRKFQVTATDFSEVGMSKAQERAKALGLSVETIVSDVADFDMGEAKWDAIVSIFGHLPSDLRKKTHGKILRALKPDGLYIMEAYTPEQLSLNTGGPKDVSMMMTEDIVSEELSDLRPVVLRQQRRIIREGKYHQGESAVIQFIGRK